MANRKIDLFYGASGSPTFEYVASTTRSKTLKAAKEAFYRANPGVVYQRIKAAFSTRINPRGTSTRTEVRSPTRTSTSTKAYTRGNVTVTGGAGAGNTSVTLRRNPSRKPSRSVLAAHARGVKARKNSSGFTPAQKRKIRARSNEMAYLTGKRTRIAVQAELAKGLWATISTYPNTEAGKHAAIESAKGIHKKVPAQSMRVIRVKR